MLIGRFRSVEEETFVFREIGSIISTLHALELPRDLVSQVTSNLGRLWHMEESWIDDLNTVVNNIFRYPVVKCVGLLLLTSRVGHNRKRARFDVLPLRREASYLPTSLLRLR